VLVLVTSPEVADARLEEVVRASASALPPGALAVQLRDPRAKSKSGAEHALAELGARLRRVTAEVGALFVVNVVHPRAGLELAVALGADGVHVPCGPAPVERARAALGGSVWLSVPSHSDDDVALAATLEVSAVLVSPVFPSPGKGTPRGVEALRQARAFGAPRVYALGGVDASRVAACREAGADGVAVIRALLESTDPSAEARLLAAPFLVEAGRRP
jgi:thiamine-phosphate pyrophosphorylase